MHYLCFIYALSMLYLCSIYALSMLYLCSIYALSMLYLCSIYTPSMLGLWGSMKKWSMNFGKKGRKRKKGFNRALFGKIGKMRGLRQRRKQGFGKGCRGGVFLSKVFFITLFTF